LRAVDISAFPEINKQNPIFFDAAGTPKDMLAILKESGVNAVRLKLWVDPPHQHASFAEVKSFAETLRNSGFKAWITVHYSDTWADPGNQQTPARWAGLDFETLKDSVFAYTTNVIREIQPDYIQIGNEINRGLLFPSGSITQHLQQFQELLQTASEAVRQTNANTRIIIHYAGYENAGSLYEQTKSIDYDIIGLSYYPLWHGKSLNELKQEMQYLTTTFDKKIVIAETAYPFTLGWNDWTNNIVGLPEQLILPDFPATEIGQRNFLKEIKTIAQEVDGGIGFCYWGAELIAWKGPEATNASPWENQALFDFDNRALPVLKVFEEE
jgi:arabinogalactan endo-1,4-beta-galactosidase